jgi:hypothetical protein
MKQTFRSVFTLFITSLIILVSCKKPVEPNKPGGGPGPQPGLSHKYRITADALPGLPNQTMANLFAKFDVVNAQDELVVNNKLAAINFNGKFTTEEMELPAGTYRISKLMIVSGTGNVLYAVPVTNSAKATQVNKPLAYPMVLPAATSLVVAAEFLKVEATDKAVDFGYAAGEFGNSNTPEETELSIKMRTRIKVGDIVYDSIQSSLVYRTFDATNELKSVKFISLVPGTNTVPLDKQAAHHEFIVQKWGGTYTKRYAKEELKKDIVYEFGEEKEAKKLKSEITARWDGNMYKAESKNNYIYDGKGRLTKVEFMQKRPADGTPFVARTENFEYTDGRVEKISIYNEGNVFAGTRSIRYNAAGKINHITEDMLNVSKTEVDIAHHGANGDGFDEVTFDFSYSNTSITMNYYQRWRHGNLFSDNSRTSNQDTETGSYQHDNNINPYVHMNWPDLFLSNSSKNNLNWQARTYYGNYPVNVAYSFEYKYDSEGYPTELIRRYKSYITGQHLFTTKTIFSY